MTYAKGTVVSVEKSRLEIERTLKRYGASHFAFMTEPSKAVIAFRAKDRNIRFDLPLPELRTEASTAQHHRERWRALAMIVKAKLEAVESGITTLEEEFFSHIVMPGGMTVYEHARQNVALGYERDEPIALLPAPGGV